MSFEKHSKGLVMKTAVLLDPNKENYMDIMNKLQEQVSIEVLFEDEHKS